MFKFALPLFVFLAIFAIGTTAGCRPDEVAKECGPACEAQCGNLSPICPAVCTPGCFCKPGLVRSANRSCISAEHC